VNVIALILIIAAVTVVRCFYLLRYPFGPCRRCQGRGTNKGSTRKRYGVCKACGGTRQRRRFGATAVHRFWWSVAGESLHRHRKEQVKAAREKAGDPE
jgi:hypothetical protein